MTCCVYFIKAFNGNGLVKIGKTTNLERRMRELKAPPGNRLYVIELPDEEIMHEVEQSLQNVFVQYRIPQSEMFSLTAEQIKECKKLMAEWVDYYSQPPLTPEQEEEERRIEELKARIAATKAIQQAEIEKTRAIEQRKAETVFNRVKAKRDRYQSTSFLLSLFVIPWGFLGGAALLNTVSDDWPQPLTGLVNATAGLVVAVGCVSVVQAKRDKYS